MRSWSGPPCRPGLFLLASDGAYQPYEDTGHDLAGYLTGTPRTAGVAGPVRPPRRGQGEDVRQQRAGEP
jgi:hypothetical protein